MVVCPECRFVQPEGRLCAACAVGIPRDLCDSTLHVGTGIRLFFRKRTMDAHTFRSLAVALVLTVFALVFFGGLMLDWRPGVVALVLFLAVILPFGLFAFAHFVGVPRLDPRSTVPILAPTDERPLGPGMGAVMWKGVARRFKADATPILGGDGPCLATSVVARARSGLLLRTGRAVDFVLDTGAPGRQLVRGDMLFVEPEGEGAMFAPADGEALGLPPEVKVEGRIVETTVRDGDALELWGARVDEAVADFAGPRDGGVTKVLCAGRGFPVIVKRRS